MVHIIIKKDYKIIFTSMMKIHFYVILDLIEETSEFNKIRKNIDVYIYERKL